RPLPFPQPGRLMMLNITAAGIDGRPARDYIPWSYPKLVAMRDEQRVFSRVAAWLPTQFTVRLGDEAIRESGEFIDAQYLATLGISPALGRGFLLQDDHLGGPRVALVSDAFWHRLFNADSAVLGRTMRVDGSTYSIVGVLPEGFSGLSGDAGFWIPLNVGPSASWPTDVTHDAWNHLYQVVGRLRPDVTAEQAQAAMRQVGSQVDAQFPAPPAAAGRHLSATAHPLDAIRADERFKR